MKIGIIGAGNVGGALGTSWARSNHRIQFGVRDATKPEVRTLIKNIGINATAAGIAEAAAFGEVVVITTPWPATQAALQSAGNLGGKILVDFTNPVKPDLSGLALGYDTSAGEQVAGWAKGARVVKCFNTTGADNMANSNYGTEQPAMFMAGNDASAKSVVAQLGKDLGFEMIDAGNLENARLLEPLAMLWIQLAVKGGLGRDFALKLARR